MGLSDFYINIEDSSGTVQGGGPITSATQWTYTARMDRAGTFSFTMPANDDMAAEVQKKRTARAYALLGSTWTEVGAGIIDVIHRQVQADSTVMLSVSGDDELRDLSNRSVGFLQIESGGSGVTHAAALTSIAALAPSGWTFNADASPGYDSIYGNFAGESVLQALVALGEKSQTHFYRSASKTVTFANTFTSSGVRAIQAKGVLASGLCAIMDLQEQYQTYDVVSRIYPYGAGQGQARLTLAASTTAAPDGYTVNKTSNYLRHVATEDAYGIIQRYLEYKDVAPVSNTDADLEAAANMLLQHAYWEMEQRNAALTYPVYSLQLGQCDVLLKPLQSVRVVYRDTNADIDIDDDLYILESTIQVDTAGLRTTGVTVSGYAHVPSSDYDTMASNMAQGALFQSHPQLNANSYTTGYRVNIDDTETASLRFRLGAEVVQVQQVLLEFTLLPFESTIRSVGGATTVTPSGGGSTTPTDGGSSTPSGGGSTTVSGGGATTPTDGSATTPSGGGATAVSESTHTHVVPDHQHLLPLYAQSGSVNSVNLSTGGGSTGTLGHGSEYFSTSPMYIYTTADSGQVTSGGGSSHSHATPDHTHTTPAHSHATPDHSHATPNHTHTTPAHSHATPNHSHTFVPEIATSYGIYRAAAADTYEISQLEYQVNSGGYADLDGAVDVGGGWYQLDVTSDVYNATTFRPNQVTNKIDIRAKTIAGVSVAATSGVVEVYYTGINGILSVGDSITISGTTNYNGVYTVAVIVSTGQANMEESSTNYGSQSGSMSIGKTVTVDALLSVRNSIQAITYVG